MEIDQFWIVDMLHILEHNSLQMCEVQATNSTVVLHCISQFPLGVLLFHDHEINSPVLVVNQYFWGCNSSLCRIECFVHFGFQLSNHSSPLSLLLVLVPKGVWVLEVVRISCRLTFNVKFKPLIIKIGWELDILCYIFWNSKIWHATFGLFFIFIYFYFSVSFYPIWMKNLSKFRENVGLQAYRLGLVLNRSFPVFLKKIERTGTIGPLEPVTVRSGSRSHSGPMNRTLKH